VIASTLGSNSAVAIFNPSTALGTEITGVVVPSP
jgi:hypothetical protein